MDRSSLSFLAGRVPAIESVDGTVGINAKLAGTLAKPDLSGDGILEISRLRLDSRDAPSFYDIDLETRFADNQVTIDRLHAIVAGGIIDGKGSILLPPGSEPKFDIALSGQEVLVYRNPDLSLRTDADLTLTGPLSKAHLAGEIGITNSRYFKNFDLLPRSLPTRNTSVLPTVERGPRGGGMAYQDLDFGVKQEPFRDWTADVRIYSKNPFLVRSNLVESDIAADLNLGGTLGSPVPVGYVELAEGEMSLPFSSIDVETGRISFDEKTGFNGALEFKAKAKADKYRINAYVYNRVLDPKYVLTSVPPMPTEDLVTLIATGTARSDLVGEGVGSLAAGKAATLLFQNMRKASAEADEEPTLLDNLQERTELDIGGVNPETGETTVGGKIRLWKQLFFVGDVDARNDYRAVLKYVFRFR
ncbi:MAG: translocation/assembly module TamB [Verrucomicrobiales bacterium]|nr:translocation/assembly module TamB [Verrucomicrobiales bacterium]